MILAVDKNYGIGKNGRMAWYYPEDFRYFKEYTKGSICLMGSKTYEDILSHKKNTSDEFLEGRFSIVFTTRNAHYEERNKFEKIAFINDASEVFPDLLYFMRKKNGKPLVHGYDSICVIGGKSLYEKYINTESIEEISVTYINESHECDVHLSQLDEWLLEYQTVEINTLSEKCTAKKFNRNQPYEDD